MPIVSNHRSPDNGNYLRHPREGIRVSKVCSGGVVGTGSGERKGGSGRIRTGGLQNLASILVVGTTTLIKPAGSKTTTLRPLATILAIFHAKLAKKAEPLKQLPKRKRKISTGNAIDVIEQRKWAGCTQSFNPTSQMSLHTLTYSHQWKSRQLVPTTLSSPPTNSMSECPETYILLPSLGPSRPYATQALCVIMPLN
ncbi:hypothetical protein BS47DRAFT_1385644 [Hydnum rufescens UP504]|uniref:Uncharacterized protein n=1 Tax=Hydnum rufescens UP504 TaxID=1448309 RepID=A0A9P6DPF4_9AGAM|nr:hypothetical protein BS47DRAFT_1385644 [Hydnum rufescens UP504]